MGSYHFQAMTRRLVLAGLVGAAALAGMADAAIAGDKIKVGALRFTSHSASFIAFEKGYFKDAGLDVEFKFFQAAAPMAVAIASGDIDYGVHDDRLFSCLRVMVAAGLSLRTDPERTDKGS